MCTGSAAFFEVCPAGCPTSALRRFLIFGLVLRLLLPGQPTRQLAGLDVGLAVEDTSGRGEIGLTVNGDLLHEADETFLVWFRNPSNATIGGFYGLGWARIVDDDPLPVLRIRSGQVAEGDEVVTGARLKNVQTSEEYSVPCGGIFYAIGHDPNTGFLGGQVAVGKGDSEPHRYATSPG